ncbi:MAG: hypothetical protein H6R14_770 [Proteobacteria bacterium]|nr:hypothetical protein [Pseudomonadota bacterium]
MANKIKLGQRPETFKKVAQFTTLYGDDLEIEMVFVYRTRKEFGPFFDTMFERSENDKINPTDPDFMAKMMENGVEKNVDYLMGVATGWNLDIEFNRANVEQLCDEMPGAAAAIMQAYYTAITEGRVKN